MMSLAKKVGIDIPECNLIEMKDIEGLPDLGSLQGHFALAVKRFDRSPDNTRIHMEDFAQVYGLYPEQKYNKVSYTNTDGSDTPNGTFVSIIPKFKSTICVLQQNPN